VTIRVLVADDQDIVRAGLTIILDAQPGIEVIAEAADGREAVALARKLRPDVCLLDIRMPEVDGIEATRQLAGPDVADPLAVVVITTFDLDEYVHGALKAGARGFLLKDAGPDLLTQAVHAAADGDAPHCPEHYRAAPRRLRPHPPRGSTAATTRTAHQPRGTGAHLGRPGLDQPRDRRRPAHQYQHSQDSPGQPHAQAGRPEPRRDGHVGLRNGSRPEVTTRPLTAVTTGQDGRGR
jgi:DNA-binding NarL/FixJ family response regulator